MVEMASRKFIPASIKYSGMLSQTIASIESVTMGKDFAAAEHELLGSCCRNINDAVRALDILKTRIDEAGSMENMKDKALFCRKRIVPAMDALRRPVDELELLVDSKLWPVPTYGELIFEV